MKRVLLWGLVVLLFVGSFQVILAKSNTPDKAIKQLLIKLENGGKLTSEEMELVEPYLYMVDKNKPQVIQARKNRYSIDSWVVNEGFETAVPPSGWINYSVTGTNSWTQTSARAHSGTYSAYFDDYSGDNDVWLITPAIDLSGMSSPILDYWENVNWSSWADENNVKISTDYSGSGDPTNATWTLLRSDIGAEDVWTEIIIDLSAYAGQTVYIAFQYVGNYASEWYIDDVQVGESSNPPNCATVVDPDSAATDVSIWTNLEWANGGGNPTGYKIYFGTDNPPTNILNGVDLGDTTKYDPSPLLGSTTYYWKIVPYNANGDATNCPVWLFTTKSTTIINSYPYSQDFDSFPSGETLGEGWENISGDDFDWSANSGSTPSSSTGPSGDHTSGSGMYLYTESSSPNYPDKTAYLMSPGFDISSLTSPLLKFWYHMYGAGMGELHLDVYANGSWHNDVMTPISGDQGDQWIQKSVDLSAFTGTIYLRFRGITGADYTSDMAIDDVWLGEAPTNPQFSIIPDSAGFGQINVGDTSAAQMFTITNNGGGSLIINSVDITGTDADQFFIDDPNTYPATLGAGQSISFDVYFAPTSNGEKSATLTITDNLTESTHTYPLTGKGYNPNYGGGGSNQGGYYFANSLATNAPSHPSFNWIDISTTGTDVIGDLSDDNVIGPYDIGFTFNFFGNDYTQFYISSNGFITFVTTSSSYPGNQTIPTAGAPNAIVALFWDDLNPTDPDVLNPHCYYGNDSNGNLVVTFENYPEYGADADGWITCQLILKQNGNIKFQYKEHGASINLNGATVGIENEDGTLGVQYRYDNSGGPLFGSPLAVEFGQDDQSLPVELNSFIAQAGNNRVFLKWTTQSEVNNLGFEIYRSLSKDGEYDLIASYENYDNLRGSGNSNTAHNYAFTDANVHNGITYYYKLADVSMNGKRHFHGPISVIPNKNGANLQNTGTIPRTFALKNNYPNPFNPTTTIGFDIPMVPGGKIQVDLSIYNMLGQKVRTLVSDVLTPGSYQITWDGKNDNGVQVANGIYFYGIRTEKFTRFRKMILMK